MLRKTTLAVLCVLALGSGSWATAAETIPDQVAWWAFDDGQGNVASDWSGNNINATVNNAPWVAGKFRSALQFNGTSAYVEAPYIPLNSRSFTITMWINPVLYTAAQVVFGQHQSGTANLSMHFRLGGPAGTGPGPGAVRMAFYSNDLNTANGVIQDNTWYHLTFWYDAATQTQRIYINGAPSAQRTATPFLGTSGVTNIGRWYSGNAQWFRGLIDDVQIYHRALQQTEIQKILGGLVDTTVAFNPDPKDKAEGVSMPLLQWKAGDGAVFHNVYVGTSPALTEADKVASNLPFPMFYVTAGLQAGITYYWRVDEVEASGAVRTGTVWSFTTTPKTAWSPQPADGTTYVPATGKLSWKAGLNAVSHDLYLGIDRAAVEAGAADTKKATAQVPTNYDAANLAQGQTYYWRVDEAQTDGARVPGLIWSFTVRPVLAKADPNLVGWWKMDDENANLAVDYSGYDNYGTLLGPTFVEGQFGEALSLDGLDDYVDCGNGASLNIRDRITIACWIKVAAFSRTWEAIIAKGDNAYRLSRSNTSGVAAGNSVHFGCNGPTGGNLDGITVVTDNAWHHVALVYDGINKIIYIDGREDARVASTGQIAVNTYPLFLGENSQSRGRQLKGRVDDARIYNRALTLDEIRKLMQGDPRLAWNPQPISGANVDIREATALSWSAGEQAAQHDVYFGQDRDAVKAADTGSSLYRGRQTDTSFALAGRVELGGGAYFWRIDEVAADGTIAKGSVWGFTIPGYLLVDEFESYTDDEGNRIYETWVDGWTNGTGSVVGNLVAPFAERTIVHSGKQAMPLDYNNIKTPFYSETTRAFAPVQSWTVEGVVDLSLWFRGNPVRYVDKGNGAFTVGGSGTDIWGNADDFRFVYKRLSGNGSIQVKVESLVNTNAWAKAGVMIRESLEDRSIMAYMIQSFSSGASFGWRQIIGATCGSATQAGITAPQWVKLTRTGNAFTAQYSADGKTWTDIKNADGTVTTTTVAMGTEVYIGLCVTSHNVAATTIAEFSGAATTGNVTGAWQQLWIGNDPDLTNGAAGLYVVVEDTAGKSVVVPHADPLAANLNTWTQWKIPLTSLAGVNLARVKKLSIGVGDRQAPVPGGYGRVYLDDILLTKP
ncbi:MAG: hypothetical protein MUC88_04040 [Planctomycetes bacterium]|nr:hypothetical protein [Planctomycetota bacterium]